MRKVTIFIIIIELCILNVFIKIKFISKIKNCTDSNFLSAIICFQVLNNIARNMFTILEQQTILHCFWY